MLRVELVLARLTDGAGGVGACCGMESFTFDVDATLSTTPTEPYKNNNYYYYYRFRYILLI